MGHGVQRYQYSTTDFRFEILTMIQFQSDKCFVEIMWKLYGNSHFACFDLDGASHIHHTNMIHGAVIYNGDSSCYHVAIIFSKNLQFYSLAFIVVSCMKTLRSIGPLIYYFLYKIYFFFSYVYHTSACTHAAVCFCTSPIDSSLTIAIHPPGIRPPAGFMNPHQTSTSASVLFTRIMFQLLILINVRDHRA